MSKVYADRSCRRSWWMTWKRPWHFWQDGLGMELTHIEDVPAEKSQVAFLPVGGSEIELVKPTTR